MTFFYFLHYANKHDLPVDQVLDIHQGQRAAGGAAALVFRRRLVAVPPY
jgi:hypothetical protein